MAMAELLPNPDGCARFEPQVWRRERCRGCGHSWKLHRGAISESTVLSFAQARLQSAQAAQAEVQSREAAARAKADARRRAQQADVDEWFFDAADGEDGSGNDSEGEGFRMHDVRVQSSAPASFGAGSSADARRPMRVVNLIDFGECNVVSVTSSVTHVASAPSSQAAHIALACGGDRPAWAGGSSSSWSSGGGNRGASGSGAAASQAAAPAVAPAATAAPASSAAAAELSSAGGHPVLGAGAASSAPAAVSGVGGGGGGGGDVGRASSSSSSFCPPATGGAAHSPSAPSASRPVAAPVAAAAASARSHAAACTPPNDNRDVLVGFIQEIQFLRQMLADANEEKKIQVAIVQDEAAETQRANEELKRRLADAEDSLRLSGKDPLQERRVLERELELKAQLQAAEERCRQAQAAHEAQLKAADDRCRQAQAANEALRGTVAARESDLAWASHRLMRLAAPEEALEAINSDAEASEWERELLEHVGVAMRRIAERRIALKIKAATARALQEVQEVGICKICFDQPSSCALLPCRHHAFCIPCAQRVRRGREPACPICRSTVTGLLETFSA